MQDQLRAVKRYLDILKENRRVSITPVAGITVCPSDYKLDHNPPPDEGFVPYRQGSTWGHGKDTHAWFRFRVNCPTPDTGLLIRTDRTGWDADNPQFIAYVNGKLRQGLDTNHLELYPDTDGEAEILLYAYTGPKLEKSRLFADVFTLRRDVEALYYDILFARQALDFLHKESDEYAQTLLHCWRAVSMLDLFSVGSEDFYASVQRAHEYMEREFYGKYCFPQGKTTVCIGHTHIDCAWLWTLRQTREKVQRSFSTVLELMRCYPEYKFMSSQALLYKNLKEEAPELYEEVKERIREGRWECEGSMWVEADCNLTSGESLVRQVLYGKRFFQKEFGVENRVLWLPDVFGYSAALPQILRKSGVDWFVTSKISWNESDRMPYDTFRWRGIDGTEINSYFLTAQGDNGGPSVRYTTYVAHTDAAMISGTYKRYSQKQLNREAILTFGFGDGGGGPTKEHLELLRRGAHGLPGLPNAKIGFAGEFLTRLEESIKNNALLPKWQGELYLEFHRGTYTAISRNKRNNRKSEFLLQNAELFASLSAALCKTRFPAEPLHAAWETVLTNQFHDIIPGSSIKEVYEQCDIDYAEVKRIGEGCLTASERQLAASVKAGEGYLVCNPNSFGGRVAVKKDGKTVYADGISPKGYSVCKHFVEGNRIRIEGREAETDRFFIRFDEAWQLASVYDKEAAREVLSPGKCGNELRVYADYPDNYDAWEWQEYSLRGSYRTLTEVTSVTELDDGIRRGIRIVRPHMSSTVTQSIWFYDDERRIDFETVADWHEKHQMLKVAFPVDINSDRATYEIQFGTVERPTHKNTSWDAARFEVCAHKYADLSDGGYGVSLINDCKYGHDIHDGVMMLSLLRSPTYPNPDADQGEIPFTYSLCPHTGTLYESHTVETAYALNNPATLLCATGEETLIPTSFSAMVPGKRNVICDTVKEAEDGDGTVIRLFETENRRTATVLHTDLPHAKVYLCNLLEEEEKELSLTAEGDIPYTFGGFEIVTLKLK